MGAKRASSDAALAKLVEKQMRNWELGKAQRLAVAEPQRREVEDFIAISRAVGTGGRELAGKVGEALAWPVFDKEILNAMAGDDVLRRQIYASMDERDLSWTEETLRALLQPEFARNDYFHRLTQTILSLARQGHAVFLGRGAHLILPPGRGFRVRLVAPFEMRLRRFAEEFELSPDQAREGLLRIENERADFLRKHFRIDTADETRHDLTVNLERFSPDQAVDLVLSTRELIRKDSAGPPEHPLQ